MATARWSRVSNGPIDFAHPPGRNQRLDLIRTEHAAGQAAGRGGSAADGSCALRLSR